MGDVEPPAPSPEMVGASRKHLTERYASGVDLLLWETEKRLVPDLDAIRSVTEAAASGRAEGLDMGAALVLVQAARLGLDRLECELFEAARAMGMRPEAIAAVLELPDAAAAEKRQRWLEARRGTYWPRVSPAIRRLRPHREPSAAAAATRPRDRARAPARPWSWASRTGRPDHAMSRPRRSLCSPCYPSPARPHRCPKRSLTSTIAVRGPVPGE